MNKKLKLSTILMFVVTTAIMLALVKVHPFGFSTGH
jgi:hypothetical protein